MSQIDQLTNQSKLNKNKSQITFRFYIEIVLIFRFSFVFIIIIFFFHTRTVHSNLVHTNRKIRDNQLHTIEMLYGVWHVHENMCCHSMVYVRANGVVFSLTKMIKPERLHQQNQQQKQ